MDLSQEFILRVAKIQHSRKKLIDLMNALDEEKRVIRSAQRKYSSFKKEDGGLTGAERFKQLRSLKDRLSFLIEEREYVRQRLADVKAETKALNKAVHRQKGFQAAFVAAAERLLPEETFLNLEAKASEILLQSD